MTPISAPPATSQDLKCGALLLGGAHGTLGVARSLGRHGIPVWLITDDHLIARFSRYTQRTYKWPGPHHAESADWLIALARQHGLDRWVLIPCADAEARLVSQHHAALSSTFRVTTPTWDVLQWAYDKRLTYERAALLGIDHPRSYAPADRREVAALDCRFPLVLKPSVRESRNAFTLAKAWRVDDRAALIERYDQAAALVGERAIVLQELIPGGGAAQFSYAALYDRATPIASLVARRTRQYPADFGYSSTYVETVEHADVEEAARRFLGSLGYSGIAELEFKYDARDGRCKLLDVNARAWTWISLGAAAGVDFPSLQWRLAMGETIAPARARSGAGWMHVSRDVVAAAREMLHGTLSPARYLRAFRRPLTFAAFALDDPMPGLVDLPLVAARLLTRRLPVLTERIARKLAHSSTPRPAVAAAPSAEEPRPVARGKARRPFGPASTPSISPASIIFCARPSAASARSSRCITSARRAAMASSPIACWK